MKIGILSREYPPLTHVGGIATYSATAARLLAARGHEVHVVCNGPATRVEKSEGVTVHRVAMLDHHFPAGRVWYPWRSAYRKHLPHYLDALTWARTAAAYLGQGLEFASFDAWEWPETMGEGALAPVPVAGRGAGPVRVCRVHTGWMDEYADNPLERALLLRLQRKACERADRVVSPTRYMADRYAGPVLGYRGEVEVSRNPLILWEEPVDWSAKSMRHVLFAGRVEWRKGLQVLLRALDALGSAADGLEVRVVGHRHPPTRERDRECLGLFEAHLARHPPGAGGTGHTLEYAGPSDHDGMRKHYDWAGILVLPSLMENYPYAALEALSRGCLLLGSDVGGIPEIIDRPGRGALFPAGNHASLARKMGQLCQRASLPEDLKRNAEDLRAEFGPDACYGRLLRTYVTETGERTASGRLYGL